MAIFLTKAAAKHIKYMLAKRGKGIGIRLGTKKSGCAGFSYVVDYCDNTTTDDKIFKDKDLLIIVNKKYISKLNGTTIDFIQQNLLNSGFEFANPNVKDSCGCGESFNI